MNLTAETESSQRTRHEIVALLTTAFRTLLTEAGTLLPLLWVLATPHLRGNLVLNSGTAFRLVAAGSKFPASRIS